MALVLQIILGVMILASFFVAFMSSKRWPIYQAVLVVFLFLGAVAFFYMGARTLAIHKSWGSLVNRLQTELTGLEQQTRQTIDGGTTPEGQQQKSMRELQQDRARLAVERGTVLYEVAVDGIRDGKVQVTPKSPVHGLVPNTVVFAFDETPLEQGGRFLGEFKVASQIENSPSVELAPNVPLTAQQADRAGASKGPWTLYLKMPIDDPRAFAGADNPARQTLVPAESREEFANADRPLRDYEQFLHDNFVQTSLLTDAISKINSDIQRLTNDTKLTNEEAAFRTQENTRLQSDLAAFKRELAAIVAYEKTLDARFAQVRDTLKATYAKNKQFAAELTATQLKAAAEINALSAPAESGAR